MSPSLHLVLDRHQALLVERFHQVPRLSPASVGHHTAGVCIVLLTLYPNASRELLIAALGHDLPEAKWGDVPAPTKWASTALHDAFQELEDREFVRLEWPNPTALSAEDQRRLKVADMADLVLYTALELRMGNTLMRGRLETGVRYLTELAPEFTVLWQSIITYASTGEIL